jgi:hypothetical protein
VKNIFGPRKYTVTGAFDRALPPVRRSAPGFRADLLRYLRADYSLAFFCRRRYFWPSRHHKRVLLDGEWLEENALANVPHRQCVFSGLRRVRHSLAQRWQWPDELCRIAARLLSQAPCGACQS